MAKNQTSEVSRSAEVQPLGRFIYLFVSFEGGLCEEHYRPCLFVRLLPCCSVFVFVLCFVGLSVAAFDLLSLLVCWITSSLFPFRTWLLDKSGGFLMFSQLFFPMCAI